MLFLCWGSVWGVVHASIFVTHVNMIGLSQWRAVIGLWNHCRIRLVNPRPLLSNSRPPHKPFDIEGGNCSLSRVPPEPPITRFSSAVSKEDNVTVQEDADSLSKRSSVIISGDTICRLATLMFYLLFLLLLSGDVELNPGPITAEQGNSSGSNNNYRIAL